MKTLVAGNSNRQSFLTLGALMLLMNSGQLQAATPEEYLKVEGKKECSSIPDSSLNSKCFAAQTNVKDYCKEFDQGDIGGCKTLKTRELNKTMDEGKGQIKNLENDKRDLISKRDSAKEQDERDKISAEIKAKDEAIAILEKEINQMSRTVEDNRSRAAGLANRAQRCRESRIDVAEIFGKATEMAKADQSSDNVDIKRIAPKLIDEWERTSDNHAKTIIQTQEKFLYCKAVEEGKE